MKADRILASDDDSIGAERPVRRSDSLMRLVVGARFVAMGALFCTVAFGAAYALATGAQSPESLDVWAAIGGGVVAAAIKVIAASPI